MNLRRLIMGATCSRNAASVTEMHHRDGEQVGLGVYVNHSVAGTCATEDPDQSSARSLERALRPRVSFDNRLILRAGTGAHVIRTSTVTRLVFTQ